LKPQKMNYKQFEHKVKTMSAHDIIMSMVEGLRKPRTEIDMYTFGRIKEGICYGCAATNAILHVMDAGTKEEVVDHISASNAYRSYAMKKFELAIDWLRRGRMDMYNEVAVVFGIAKITPIPGVKLPCLDADYT